MFMLGMAGMNSVTVTSAFATRRLVVPNSGAQLTLGVEEKRRTRGHLFAFLEPPGDLNPVIHAAPDLHSSRREPSLAQRDEHDLIGARVKNRVRRNR